ncbi:hypothetical protein WHL36_14550, partial [Staphylococcus aureus]|uniref:hypothetical protein n=1 Tax=Staphylococcus aureus TaxID=1280 RepID=UPI0039BDF299
PKKCKIRLTVRSSGREGARIRGDDNDIELFVTYCGQKHTLTAGSGDKAGLSFAKSQSTAPTRNHIRLTVVDDGRKRF